MDINPLGKLIEFKLWHALNAQDSIDIKPVGKFKVCKLVYLNAASPMDIKLDGKSTELNLLQDPNVPSCINVKLSGKFIEANFPQPPNAPSSIDFKLAGKLTEDNLLQPENAFAPIDITLSGISIFFGSVNVRRIVEEPCFLWPYRWNSVCLLP